MKHLFYYIAYLVIPLGLFGCETSSLLFTVGTVAAVVSEVTSDEDLKVGTKVGSILAYTAASSAYENEQRKKIMRPAAPKHKRMRPNMYTIAVLPKGSSPSDICRILSRTHSGSQQKRTKRLVQKAEFYLENNGFYTTNTADFFQQLRRYDCENITEVQLLNKLFENTKENSERVALSIQADKKLHHGNFFMKMKIQVFAINENSYTASSKLLKEVNINTEPLTSKQEVHNELLHTFRKAFKNNIKPFLLSREVKSEYDDEDDTEIIDKEENYIFGKPKEENTVKVVADEFVLKMTKKERPNAIAVVIGNQKYIHKDVPEVSFARRDARKMKEFLIKKYGFDEGNIIQLDNASLSQLNAVFGTKGDHKAKLYNYTLPKKSDIFIYYSGHGIPEIETQKQYIVPKDCDPSLVKYSAYPIETLYSNLSKIPYKSLYVVIDACFSGMSESGAIVKNVSPVFIKTSKKIFRDERAVIFNSCRAEQVSSWYNKKQYSMFSYFFFKAMMGSADSNRNKELTIKEMQNYLDEQVSYTARRENNRQQNPQVYGLRQRVFLPFD